MLISIREDSVQLPAAAPTPAARCTLIDVKTPAKEIRAGLAALAISLGLPLSAVLIPSGLRAQTPSQTSNQPTAETPPPSTGGFFPLSEVRKGLMGTAWTVFEGTKPEPMQVEILGVLRGARGPGQDMILAKLHGAKPEYTGVVAGMSGSPVYIGNRLLGSLSYRIGEFSKDPIAGITPIAQMLEVRDIPIPIEKTSTPIQFQADADPAVPAQLSPSHEAFQAMETPLVMSGLRPEAIHLWQKQMAGTGLDIVSAGGASGSSDSSLDSEPSAKAAATVLPGSAVSAQLVRGDLEIAATCTVTYIDPTQLLACGHPILQSGPISLPMTTAEVVATLASPLDAFKIINTGQLIGAYTEDRATAIRGVLGQMPRMIPLHISIHAPQNRDAQPDRKLNVEILDLPMLTPQAMLVSLYNSLLETNESSDETSYHLTGSITLASANQQTPTQSVPPIPSIPLDEWASAGDAGPAQMMLALQTASRFARIYSNGTRQGSIKSIDLHIESIPRRVLLRIESARLTSSDIVHPGDTVFVEATLRPFQQPEQNVRIPVKLPARLSGGNLRILVSDAGTLDRTLDQPRSSNRPIDLDTVLALDRNKHPADHIYVSLLVPETQAGIEGQTLTSLPLSVANALEPLRSSQDLNLSGESAIVTADVPTLGPVSGFQILNLRIEPGGGLN